MTITTAPIDNGVNVEALLGARAAFAETPEIAQFEWRSSVTWENGTHSRSEVESFYGFADEQVHHQSFTLDADHPLQFAAQDKGPTPVEYLLHALAGCLTTALVYHAAAQGIEVGSVTTRFEGDLDLRGFLGLSHEVRRGCKAVRAVLAGGRYEDEAYRPITVPIAPSAR